MDSSKLNEAGENLFEATMIMHTKLLNPHSLSKSCEIPQSQVRVLFFLRGHGETTMSKMAHMLTISRPNLTPIVDKLMEEGYLKRNASKKDRRTLIISLSDEGREYLKKLDGMVMENSKERISVLSDEDIASLSESAKNIVDILTKL